MNFLFTLLTLVCSVHLALGAPTLVPPVEDSTPDEPMELFSSTSESPLEVSSLPAVESSSIESKKTKERVKNFAKNTGRKPEEVEEVRSLLQAHRQNKQKERQQQREKLRNGAEFKVLREKQARKNKVHKQKHEKQLTIAEANANAEVSDLLYNGDIVLTVEQAKEIASGKKLRVVGEKKPDWWHNMGNRKGKKHPKLQTAEEALLSNNTIDEEEEEVERAKRQAFNPNTEPNLLWPNAVVPYAFGSEVTEARKSMIRKAISYWYDNTCLWHQEKSSIPAGTAGVVYKTPSNQGCSSAVGRSSATSSQVVTLTAGGCDSVGIMAHETAHSVGFWHAQNRYDREDWVSVWLPNIEDTAEHNFDLIDSNHNNNFGQEYDFGSVMHYGSHAFGIPDSNGNAQQTIWTMPQSPSYEWDNTIGTRITGPTFTDYKVMNSLYNCQAQCASNPKTCYRGGFQNPNDCSGPCKCPPGVGGDQCLTPSAFPSGFAPSGVANTCTGAYINVPTSGAWTTLSSSIGSTSWGGNSLKDVAWCHWYLLAPTDYHLVIEVQSVGGPCGYGCGSGYTEVRASTTLTNWDWSKTGRHICCSDDLTAQGGSTLTFTTAGPNAYISSYAAENIRSFTLRYKAVHN